MSDTNSLYASEDEYQGEKYDWGGAGHEAYCGQNGLTPGNTRTGVKSHKKPRGSASKYWCFTFHDWVSADPVKLVKVFETF